MRRHSRLYVTVLLASGGFAATACGRSHDATAYPPATQSAPATTTSGGDVAPSTGTAAAPMDTVSHTHHSKLAGALVGAAAGHALGHHAVAGAVAGALVQHARNHRH